MLAFRVELGSYDLDLVDGLGCIAEFAWRTETIRTRRGPEPQLIDACEGQIQFDLVSCAVFTEIERHLEHSERLASLDDINCCASATQGKCLINTISSG